MKQDNTIESPLAQMKRTGRIGVKSATTTGTEAQEGEQVTTEPGVTEKINGKREKLQVYISPDLTIWVRHQAVDQRREISEVVEEALRRYQLSLQG